MALEATPDILYTCGPLLARPSKGTRIASWSNLHGKGAVMSELMASVSGGVDHGLCITCRWKDFAVAFALAFCRGCVVAAALLSWAFSAQYGSDGSQVDPGNGCSCAWVTHPLFNFPNYGCNIVIGEVIAEEGNADCNNKYLKKIMDISVTVEYLFIKASLTDLCSFTTQEFDALHNGWLQHALNVTLMVQNNLNPGHRSDCEHNPRDDFSRLLYQWLR